MGARFHQGQFRSGDETSHALGQHQADGDHVGFSEESLFLDPAHTDRHRSFVGKVLAPGTISTSSTPPMASKWQKKRSC